MYLPGSPSALAPVEWAMFAGWMLLGLAREPNITYRRAKAFAP